ncbi:MAG: sulfatase [Pseudomonadota bacterium]|nr:sulfatase [Pseudomonadota bacterium]
MQHRLHLGLGLLGSLALLATPACGGDAAPTATPAATPGEGAPAATTGASATPGPTPPGGPAKATNGAPPNVLIVVMDTLRADALGTYGQKRPTSPNIDALAAQSVVWESAWTQYTWTLPSFVSYMTSSWARTHGWDYSMGKLDTYKKLDAKIPTIAEVFGSAGYATTGRYANMHLKDELGFGRGFDTWKLAPEPATVRAAVSDIGTWKDDGKPNFLYVHLMAPHVALLPTPESQAAIGVSVAYEPKKGLNYDHYAAAPPDQKAARQQELMDAYLACVRDGDNDVGEILKALDASGAGGDTIVAFWSDHGEMLGEHGHIGHNMYVWEEVVEVPLFIRAPGLPARREATRVGRLIDAAPTLVELAGLHVPDAWQGQSLLTGDQPIVGTERDSLASFKRGSWKTVEDRAKDKFMYAYDLGADPGELAQVKDQANPGIVPLLADSAAWRLHIPSGDNTGEGLALSDAEHAETVKQLEALGYTEK